MSKWAYIKLLLFTVLAFTTACKKEVDTPSAPAVQTVHYKASIQAETDTRATLGTEMQYVFEVGDRVYVESEDGKLYGFLSLAVDTGAGGSSMALFEGDLTYEGDTPLDNPAINLVLVSKEDELHTITEGKVNGVTKDSYIKTKWAPSLEEAVSQLSHFTGSGHFQDYHFSIQQQSSFLKCFVRLKSDQAPVNRTILAQLLDNNSVVLREASIKVSEVGSVPFVFAFLGGETLEDAQLVMTWEQSGGTSFNLSSTTLAANKYYTVSRSTLSFDGFHIKAITNNTVITFNYDYEHDGIEYSKDYGESWTHYSAPFELNKDEVACIKGNRTNYKNDSGDQWGTPGGTPIFTASRKCYIGGDIMSLLKDETLAESAFQGAFSKGSGTPVSYIDIDPDSPLILSATTLVDKCYMQMFRNCTSLTRAPRFRVEVTAYRCCYNMFRQCSGLVDVSGIELPAMTLSVDCYRELFRACTNLKAAAPILPAPVLVKECYRQMFSDSKVSTITCLATDVSAQDCLNNWMSNIAGGGTFYRAPGATHFAKGQNGIPNSWTVLDYSE